MSEITIKKKNIILPFAQITEEYEQNSCIFGEDIKMRDKELKQIEDPQTVDFKIQNSNSSTIKFTILEGSKTTLLDTGKAENFTPKTDATMDPESCKRLNKAAEKLKKKVNLKSGFKIKKKNKKKKGVIVEILEPEDVDVEEIFQQKEEIMAPIVEIKEDPILENQQSEEKVEILEKEESKVELKKFYSLKFEQKMELIRKLDKDIVRDFFEKDYEGKIFSSFERRLKQDAYFLRKYKLPLIVNQKGKLEYMRGYSYHKLLSLRGFGDACRDCDVNPLDATKDKRRKITKKIWSRLRHVYFLNRPIPDENLRFNQDVTPQDRNEDLEWLRNEDRRRMNYVYF